MKQKGFTLIEALIIVGILAILLTITLIALNPRQQTSSINNSQRQSDVAAIAEAINRYKAANKGSLPQGIDATAKTIGSGSGHLNLCAALVPTYIADLPLDPTVGTKSPANSSCRDSGTAYNTGYTVKTASNRVTVSAPSAQDGEIISATR